MFKVLTQLIKDVTNFLNFKKNILDNFLIYFFTLINDLFTLSIHYFHYILIKNNFKKKKKVFNATLVL